MIYNGFTKGEYKSEYIQDGFSSMVNVDTDSKRGTCKGQLALKVDSTTPYYLNTLTTTATADNIANRGDVAKTRIFALCSYL